jgi:phage-related protein (TIGR01555 family)
MAGFLKNIRQKVGNMLLSGGGAETLQDRGSLGTAAKHTLNPYYSNNFLARWQEYVRWYNTAWEAQKIVDIPVQDALRLPVRLTGIDSKISDQLLEVYYARKLDKTLFRALVQERLLGGCVIMGVFREPSGTDLAERFHLRAIDEGDFLAANIIDITRISLPEQTIDPFSPEYDNITRYAINGVPVHTSRLCVLDGGRLFSNATRMTLESYRYNPAGFGESILAKLYDLLMRVVGTQEGAYHLVNMSSCLIMSVARLRQMEAAGSPAYQKMEQIIEMLSIYRGAIVDAEDVGFKQHAASFGSVPELVMSFLHILSAAADIPAARFLGESPGGLNSTGNVELENYYNMIASWQEKHVKAIQKKLFDWIGANIYGGAEWRNIGADLILEYDPLWNSTALEQMQVDTGYMAALSALVTAGTITSESAIEEMESRKVFQTSVEAGDPVELSSQSDYGGGGGWRSRWGH